MLSNAVLPGRGGGVRGLARNGFAPRLGRTTRGELARFSNRVGARTPTGSTPLGQARMRRTCSTGTLGISNSSAAFFSLGGVLAFMKAKPFATQVGLATVKTSLADLVVQVNVEKRESIDWRRNSLFILFGGAYLGVFQWVVYVRGFSKLFPGMAEWCNLPLRKKLQNRAGIKMLFAQIALDFVMIQPFMYFPVFYGFKSIVDEPDESQRHLSRIARSFENWKTNFVSDNVGMMAFWLPADIVIYSVPLWLRLPLNHGISFAWCCILSIFRGGDAKEEEEALL